MLTVREDRVKISAGISSTIMEFWGEMDLHVSVSPCLLEVPLYHEVAQLWTIERLLV